MNPVKLNCICCVQFVTTLPWAHSNIWGCSFPVMNPVKLNHICCVQFVTTLPRTHYLGVDVSKGLTISHMASHPQVSYK